MNRSLADVVACAVSQSPLPTHGATARASLMLPPEREELYLAYVEVLRAEGVRVATGFGAHMRVSLVNDGR
jgi:D-Tyr-tRNAtyr deacylase